MYLRLRVHSFLPWWRRGDESADDALSPGPTNGVPGVAADGAVPWFLGGLWPSLGGLLSSGCSCLEGSVCGGTGQVTGSLGGQLLLALPVLCPTWI